MRPLLGENGHSMIELDLGDRPMLDGELCVSLCKPDFGSIWPEGGQLHEDVGRYRNSR